jgi:hypothetical protein
MQNSYWDQRNFGSVNQLSVKAVLERIGFKEIKMASRRQANRM